MAVSALLLLYLFAMLVIAKFFSKVCCTFSGRARVCVYVCGGTDSISHGVSNMLKILLWRETGGWDPALASEQKVDLKLC